MVLGHNWGPKSGGGQASENLEVAPAGPRDPSSKTQLHPGAYGQPPRAPLALHGRHECPSQVAWAGSKAAGPQGPRLPSTLPTLAPAIWPQDCTPPPS